MEKGLQSVVTEIGLLRVKLSSINFAGGFQGSDYCLDEARQGRLRGRVYQARKRQYM